MERSNHCFIFRLIEELRFIVTSHLKPLGQITFLVDAFHVLELCLIVLALLVSDFTKQYSPSNIIVG